MKVISLFCGCGGMDLGLVKAGHKIVWANDNDKDSIDTYTKYFTKKFNYNKKHIICDSIRNIDAKNIPDADIVVGGFPCQGFSIANLYRVNQRDSEKNNNSLYKELLRIVSSKKPKYFLGENVKGILSLGGYANDVDKKNKEGRVVKQILKDMRSIGYNVKWKLLNASSYGVPQNRQRVIFFGIRKDLGDVDLFTYPLPTHSVKDDLYLEKTPIIWDAIGDLEKVKLNSNNIYNHVCTQHKVKINGYIGNRKTLKDKISPTIVGRGGGTGGPVIMPHPNNKRRLTVRETARIQCFPDDMEFLGSKSSAYRQIGNAVPWKLAYCLGVSLNNIKK